MNVREGSLPGLLIIQPAVHHDHRGYFLELWQQARYADLGIPGSFVQDNATLSHRGVLRGIHFQHPQAQAKLVSVLWGETFDVAVDLRVGSPTFGRWEGHHLSAANALQLYLPPGMAHGALTVSPIAVLSYKCGELRVEGAEQVLRWDDPEIGVQWPLAGAPIQSARDAAARRLRDFPLDALPRFDPQPAQSGLVDSVRGALARDM